MNSWSSAVTSNIADGHKTREKQSATCTSSGTFAAEADVSVECIRYRELIILASFQRALNKYIIIS
jgi:hypothetical protein